MVGPSALGADKLFISAACCAVALALAPVAGAQALLADGSCRDGLPYGSYQLRDASGQIRVAGAFNKGRRTGSFLFWSSNGSRLALLPFEDDQMSGTVALWYLPLRGSAAPLPKLEAVFLNGQPAGFKRSWHANGALRAEFRYEQGAPVAARAFDEAVATAPPSCALGPL